MKYLKILFNVFYIFSWIVLLIIDIFFIKFTLINNFNNFGNPVLAESLMWFIILCISFFLFFNKK